MESQKKTETLQLRLTVATKEKLKRLAAADGRTLSQYITRMIDIAKED